MSIYSVPEEYMHCFNVFDEIPDYEPMEVENINDLYQTTELEWHHWKGPNEDESVPEPAVKKLLDLKSYQVYRQILENEHHSKAEEQPITVEIQNDLKQSRKKIVSKKTRGAYRTYSPEQVQELLDLVIEEGLSARKAGAIVGIVERTAQNYVKTYKEDDEKRLPGGRKQRVSWERKLQPHHTNFLCVFYEKNPQAVLWQARDALLEAFSEIRSITLSGLHRHLVLHASLTLEKLEAIVSSRNTLGNLQIRRDRILEWKSDENMNWHKNCVFIDEAGFNMHIRRNFGRSKRGMPAKAVIPANRGITVSIIGAICEKRVIDLTLRKPKAVQKKTNSNKKRKKENDKAEVVEANARIGTRSEHFIEFLIGVMDTLDQFDMKGRYLVMDNAAIHKVTEVKDLIASRGYKVIYLPPYSPFLNPIELFWSKMSGP
ncbi:hypothetical protein RO3G_16896 [Rhizopus delemar RA 99-880]|uniref:Tc1-like transposase DDE domain-containing protein n=1 Tax=Rhizopus delemar (strain RA 99-880 / ATCC MYA-4621 / FGSC 9543 / NRRL 43880) TaxID=246409 RepID=I1CUQ5_RHIO9|nr:hypothetical protein RO3G_16896 [Rhizopus delemar RA 99-880]|eukprot:EIE92185.1 hypothetical protein RO3G_16896 [Rhizopus delemar RA 99-880]